MEIQLLLELNGGMSQKKGLEVKIELELNDKKYVNLCTITDQNMRRLYSVNRLNV